MERGEVYYLRSDESYGWEMANGRPCLIISSNNMINIAPTVTVAYLTTSPRNFEDKVELDTPRRKSWVRCDQIYTVDKTRLTEIMCKLTDWEMDDVDKKLMDVLGLQQSVEVQEVIEQVNIGPDVLALKIELDTYKSLYVDLVKQITDARFERTVEIKANEPIRDGKLKTKANINTDDWETIRRITGMNEKTAKNIERWRNKNGEFLDVKELLLVPHFGNGCMDKYGPMLEV